MGKLRIPEELMTPRQRSHRKSNQKSHQQLLANPEKHAERKEKQKAYNKKYRKEHPDRVKNQALRYRYGISLDDATAMLEKQSNVCALCFQPFGLGAMKAFVDHNHETGKVRGILHSQCNTGLAVIEDEEFRFAAEAYLEETK
jgi:hypothetical protein